MVYASESVWSAPSCTLSNRYIIGSQPVGHDLLGVTYQLFALAKLQYEVAMILWLGITTHEELY